MKAIDRIFKYFDYKQIRPTRFEKEAGISNGYFGNQLKRRSDLGESILNKIIENAPEINPIWLLTGKGPMLEGVNQSWSEKAANKASGGLVAHRGSHSEAQSPKISDEKGVPYFDVDFIGDFDQVLNDRTVVPSFYIDFAPFNNADYWLNITGQSMDPMISNGDLIALERLENWREFILFDEIYAVVADEFRTVKIVGKGRDQEHFNLISYNKSGGFSEQQIPKPSVRHVFKVKGCIKKFF